MTNEGKVHSIGLKDNSYGYAVMQLQSDHFHGVHCLKGIARSLKKHWIDGRRVYIPIAQISSITEYESWEDFVAACRSVEEAATPPAPPTQRKKITKRANAKRKR